MKTYQMYVCGKCGAESKIKEDIELCEGKHIGLNSLADIREYETLLERVRYYSGIVSHTNNDETRQAQDDAIDKLIEFERSKSMIGV